MGYPPADCNAPTDSEARILDYWLRRQEGLSEAEWTDFYQRLMPVLLATQLPAEFSDRKARQDLVNVFFTEKIFLNARVSRAGPLESVHALHLYLKRFALDIQRRTQQTRAFELPEDATGEAADAQDSELGINHAQVLHEAGIDPQAASHSAARFLQALDAGEVAYLQHHSCADEEARQSISGIAQRLALGSSYHYRAKSLGITRSKGETYVGYEKTKIGAWLVSLGAQLNEAWQMELAVLLILLCLQVQATPERAQ